jgi:predicted transcriptional regulator
LSSGEQQRKSSARVDLYVIARVIKTLKENGRMNRTALATCTGLSYDNLVRYLSWMSARSLVRLDDKDGCVVLTDRGDQAYDDLVKWIMEYVGRLRFSRLGAEKEDDGGYQGND